MDDLLSKLGLGGIATLAFNPQAAQLFNMIFGLQQHQADREFRKQQSDREYELQKGQLERQNKETERRQADADTELQISLAGAGAQKGNPQGEELLTSLFGAPPDPRPRVDTRIGSYYLPTEKEKRQKAIDQYKTQKLAEQEIKNLDNVNITLPEEMGGYTLPVKREEAFQRIVDLFKARNPNLSISAQTDADGNVTVLATDPRTGNLVKKTDAGRIGKGIQLRTIQSTDDDGNVTVTAIDEQGRPIGTTGVGKIGKSKTADTTKNIYSEIDDVQKLINTAKALEAKGEDAEAAWSAAQTAAENAVKRYPQQIEGGRGSNGHVYIKQRDGVAKPGTVQTGTPARTTITRQQYLDYVRVHGEAKAKEFMQKYKVTIQ